MGTRGGKQINQHDPMAVMACERDRFDTLLAGTHGMRPPERLHMRWTNTWFRQGVELSRGAMQQFNMQQMATGQGQASMQQLLRSPKGEDQWRRFKAEGLVQHRENAALLKSLVKQINPVARMVVARTNQLQATAGPHSLPHKLYRSTAIREVEQLWEDKFRLKNLKAFAKAIHNAMKSDPKFAERSLAEWKALI
ncbi:hypothetical protein WJX84_003823 [Apatococcus fuscideae]|uniref:Uncharacterized protein n=1 Tax=Apatococcus fuscideae TaxID=2026836 RepID=A0AAW1T4V7_9CHLO